MFVLRAHLFFSTLHKHLQDGPGRCRQLDKRSLTLLLRGKFSRNLSIITALSKSAETGLYMLPDTLVYKGVNFVKTSFSDLGTKYVGINNSNVDLFFASTVTKKGQRRTLLRVNGVDAIVTSTGGSANAYCGAQRVITSVPNSVAATKTLVQEIEDAIALDAELIAKLERGEK